MFQKHPVTRRRLTAASALMLLAMCLTLITGPLAAAQPAFQGDAPQVVSPEVIHTGAAPTGYEVTFRYYDPTATSVRIKGEWYFSDAATANASPPTSAGRLPSQWQVGDFPIAYPNSAGANWPVNEMTFDPATGVWSFTTPLPSGVFTYAFYKNCPNPLPSTSGCAGFADPANLPWNAPATSPRSTEPTSQVFVPSDPAFGTIDYSWQFPAAVSGALAHVVYQTPLSTNPPGEHGLVVYTPPGYDPNRAIPYPTLYLSHGAGGNEVDWSTQGVAGNIVDNLILAGKAQPMVVVMTNFNGISAPPANSSIAYARDVIENVIPYVEANYNVSENANDRAFAGLSAGGARANTILLNYTTAFGYYDSMSNAGGFPTSAADPLWSNPDLRTRLAIHVTSGIDDPIVSRTYDLIALLTANNIPFTQYLIDSGHNWHVWRILLRDFVENVAFRHTTTTLAAGADLGALPTKFVIATVVPSTTEPARPTGTVQFYIDGRPVAPARPVLPDGTAKLNFSRLLGAGEHTITAVYSGDRFYNPSETEMTLTR